MDLYLMQHGEAVAAEVDPERPLDEAGRGNAAAVAARAARCGVRIEAIRHSDKLRAVQTAQILGRTLGCADVAPATGLHPKDPVEVAVLGLIHDATWESLAIVGHLPFLDRLASLLVAGDQDVPVIAFHNAGLVKLVPAQADQGFVVDWVLTPQLAQA